MDPVIHSVANATLNHRLKSTPSFILITDFPLMQCGTHLVSKHLLVSLISTIFTKRTFILTICISILENQTQSLEVSTTTARTSEPNLIPRVHNPSISCPRIPHLRNRLLRLIVSPQAPELLPPPTKPVQQPIGRVMALQQRPDAPCLSLSPVECRPSTTPNNNNLCNRQLDFTPSPPLDRTSWSKVPQRRPHARNRIFDSNW